MKKYLITGLITLLPISLTLMLFTFLINFLTDPFIGIIETFFITQLHWFAISKFLIRILAIFLLFALIFLLGFIARWFLIKTLIKIAQKIFSKIPLIKPIYNASKDIAQAIFSSGKRTAFQHPLIMEFPTAKSYDLSLEKFLKLAKKKFLNHLLLSSFLQRPTLFPVFSF